MDDRFKADSLEVAHLGVSHWLGNTGQQPSVTVVGQLGAGGRVAAS
jgi:hypothetical protein